VRGRTKVTVWLAAAALAAVTAPTVLGSNHRDARVQRDALAAYNTPGAWQDVAPLPQTLFGPATTSDGTYVYAFGGCHSRR
jgi:hypothetical protein